MIRKILGACIAAALTLAPLGSAIWADHHEQESTAAPSAAQQTQEALQPGSVNINTANAEELQMLPKIGPQKAQAIIDYRKEHGNFTSLDDLKNVSGIGEKIFEGLKQYITLSSSTGE